MISYYELLGMIKEERNPEQVKIKHYDEMFWWTGRTYEYQDCYQPHRGYLKYYFDETTMFNKDIEIIEELNEKEKIQDNQE